MSQENIERVHRLYETFNRRDLDAFLGLIDPEVDFTSRVVQVAGDPHYHGHDGIREWWHDLLAIFPDFNIEAIEVRNLGHTIIGAHIRGHGGDSDAPFEQRIWQANEWRNGKLVWWQTFDREASHANAPSCRKADAPVIPAGAPCYQHGVVTKEMPDVAPKIASAGRTSPAEGVRDLLFLALIVAVTSRAGAPQPPVVVDALPAVEAAVAAIAVVSSAEVVVSDTASVVAAHVARS